MTTRRQFLQQSARALIAGTAAAGSLSLAAHVAQAVERSGPERPSSVDSTPADEVARRGQAPPFGPPSRTATLDHWIEEFDTTIMVLERCWSFLIEARSLPAHHVDGLEFLELENAARDRLDGLCAAMAEADFDDMWRAMAGRSGFYYALAADIQKPGANREKLQACITDYGQDYPQAAGELQAMLDAYCGVAR